MPELPEVETTRRGLERSVKAARITKVELRRADIRQPIPEGFRQYVTGATILHIRRRAKYLLIDLDNAYSILAHLGMSGSFTVAKAKEFTLRTHDHVLFSLSTGLLMVFNDPRRFGVIDLVKTDEAEQHPLLRHLGPEPLSEEFSESYLKAQLSKRKGPIKPVLMDQKLVVGVGNIYASESLYRCGIHPETVANQTLKKVPQLIDAIRYTLEAAIQSGGSTLRNYVGTENQAGYFQHHFHVYDRAGEPCGKCGTKIEAIVQAGRATFYCARCQRLPGKTAETLRNS